MTAYEYDLTISPTNKWNTANMFFEGLTWDDYSLNMYFCEREKCQARLFSRSGTVDLWPLTVKKRDYNFSS